MSPAYDPLARRDTPLALELKAEIRERGPLAVSVYMQRCLFDDRHGFYTTKTAIGRDGSFITAPEISQIFGELVGLWAAVVWQQMGSPPRVRLVEIGPGRGTMIADALRAAAKVPGFTAALEVVLVEPSPILRRIQQDRLAGLPAAPAWRETMPALDRPTIVVGNEVLDCEDVAQSIKTTKGWSRRVVALDERDRLVFEAEVPPLAHSGLGDRWPDAPNGAVFERIDPALVDWLNVEHMRAAAPLPVAGLLIDYGHLQTALGDTLQAIRDHQAEHPLTSPGEADLTAHVDFEAFGARLRDAGLAVDGPVTQAEFLGRLGIVERASLLMAANPSRAHDIETSVARLIAPGGMGGRFKAIGFRSPNLPALPGLATSS